MLCKICNKEFKALGTHILKTHNINVKEYYDKFLKNKNDSKCLNCGNDTSFMGLGGYSKFCSIKCSASYEGTKQKRKNTSIKRYGYEHHLQNDTILQKQIDTIKKNFGVNRPYQNKNIKEKGETTCLERFGYKSPLSNKEVQQQIKNTIIEKYGVDNVSKADVVIKKIKDKFSKLDYSVIIEKRKNTCLNKYGVSNPSKINDIKEQKKETSLNNCGKEHWTKTDNGREICRNIAISYVEHQQLKDEPLCPRIGYIERDFLNELQKYTKYQIQRNPKIIGYFPDGYIEELKLVIEFDERYHFVDEWITYRDKDIQKNQDYQNKGLKIFRIKMIDWEQNQNNIIEHFKEIINE